MKVVVKKPMKLITLLGVLALAASTSAAGVLQATRGGGELYAVQERETLRIGRLEGSEDLIPIPRGASIHEFEPLGSGWLAAGYHPSGDGTELFLIERRDGSMERLPVPQVEGATLSNQPIAMIQDGTLAGLVWAAGSDMRSLEIWAAEWLHGKWGEPELVAAKGPGSQVAPRAVVLEDGSWLVVWAAFDGEDDEIVWSLRGQGEWTKPARVAADNAVPDITPQLLAIDRGALVAWSWYDGNDYRMKTARFTAGEWTNPGSFGAKGSVYPSVVQTDDGGLLLYKTVEPATWTVLAFDRQGVAQRRAVVAEDSEDRPVLAIDEGRGALLRWQGGGGSFDLARDRAAAWQELP
jgi:hypothetical protein